MDRKFENDIFERDISIEEFDHITDGVEDHVFSKEYLAGKESIMKNSTKAKISNLRIKVAAAACAVVVASPFVVNAAMNGELFNRIWGNEGKDNVPVHTITYVEDGKIDEKGNPVSHKVTMPKIEYKEQDPETAQRLLKDKYTANPVQAKIGDTTVTVESVVRDGIGIVASYTVEKPGGVDCFNYSQLDNETKGAWFREDQNIMFGFKEGGGKIWVDLAKSTKDKLYCYEYMYDTSVFAPELNSPIKDHITLEYQVYKDTRENIFKDEQYQTKGDAAYIKESKEVKIPVADKLETRTLKSDNLGSIKLSAIAMQWDSTGGKAPKGEAFDSVKSVKITFKDGSVYDMYEFGKVESVGYICGNETGFISLFNRLVDTNEVDSITINGTEFK
ncbi:MAG: hypothetical protein J6W36_05665 [Clostridiales bacterium]|nr:hypothetical protein [Clostridiales bacterium]